MVVRVAGRIPIRHPGRCEMGKWDKLSKQGVRGNRALMLLFGGFFHLLLLQKCKKKKPTREIKTGPFIEGEAAFSQDGWRRICLEFSAIWLSELFPVVIKS